MDCFLWFLIFCVFAGVYLFFLGQRDNEIRRQNMLAEAERLRLSQEALEAERLRLVDSLLAYNSALDKVRSNPTSLDFRQEVLRLGREYASLTREDERVTTFDEIALKNDIDAASAGAVSIANQRHSSPSDTNAHRDEWECPFCSELILRKAKIGRHCKQEVGELAKHDTELASPDSSSDEKSSKVVECVCGARLKIPAEHSGKIARCPKCKGMVEVP